ncbi:MAG: CvpA family protein [Clostridia bacterium]|nr:CvpA family protein [Clostridia bacterium]
MKDKILTFVIGVLVGAIITTLGFYIYQKVNNNKVPQMLNGDRQMNEQMMRPRDGEAPPEMPSEFNNQFNMNEQQMSPDNYGNI